MHLVFGVKMEEGWSKDKTSSSSLEGRTIERLRRREEVELSPARTDPRSGDVHDDQAKKYWLSDEVVRISKKLASEI